MNQMNIISCEPMQSREDIIFVGKQYCGLMNHIVSWLHGFTRLGKHELREGILALSMVPLYFRHTIDYTPHRNRLSPTLYDTRTSFLSCSEQDYLLGRGYIWALGDNRSIVYERTSTLREATRASVEHTGVGRLPLLAAAGSCDYTSKCGSHGCGSTAMGSRW